MIFYRLQIMPGDGQGEGEDLDKWFTSLKAAKRARAEEIREVDWERHCYAADFKIDRITIPDKPSKQLILAVLNRSGFVSETKTCVSEYHRQRVEPKE